jgi:mono/diheme cytochrome c family protein/uncharacterized cupredoxin-like copper-binding protein
MNTGKQINAMVFLLFALVVSLGAYAIFDPWRADESEAEILEKSVDRGAETFALNCRLCHGDRGQGGADGGRLSAAAVLDKPELQGIEDGTFTPETLADDFQLVTDTIMCGRVGTAMPAWAEHQGGTLNEEQIRQLALLITGAHWDLAQEHADEIDAEATGHAHVEMPDGGLTPDGTELIVSNAKLFTNGQYIRIKVDEETEERMRILPRRIVVERGVNGTEAADHDAGVDVLQPSDPEIAGVLTEDLDEEATTLVVSNPDEFTIGATLVIEQEQLEVVEVEQGIPTTGQVLANDIGMETDRFLASGSEGIEEGLVIRLEGELMEVDAVLDDGETDITIDLEASATSDSISVSDPAFFRNGYNIRVGEEWMEVIDAVELGQVMFDGVGRAETTLSITGTAGIEEGMVVRVGSELMRIESIINPAEIDVSRAQEETAASPHAAGAAISSLAPAAEGEEAAEPEFLESGQTVLEGINSEATTITISGTDGVPLGGTIRIGDEILNVTDMRPAQVKVERAVDNTEASAHARRSILFDRNLLQVERGVQNTSAQAHAAGDDVFMTEVDVERAVDGSPVEAHSKGVDIFIGNILTVERGVLETEPAEHPNGSIVYAFPEGPTEPARNVGACGQFPPAEEPPEEEDVIIQGGADVEVSLAEWTVEPSPASALGAPGVNFLVTNEGGAAHNFRVLQTDLPADALPVENQAVNESAPGVQAVGGFSAAIEPEVERVSAITNMVPGNYVLICNVPTHYDNGMFVAFQVQ